MMIIRKVVRQVFSWMGWGLLVYFTYLIIANSLPYFSLTMEDPFIREHGAIGENPFWQWNLIIHVAGGIVCLVATFLQFNRPFLRKFRHLHRILGSIYVWSALLVVCPTGIYLAFYAKGGASGKAGFLVLAILTIITTGIGYRAMRQKNMQKHIRWIVRSFALIVSAFTFRILHVAGYFLKVDAEMTYIWALWLSIIINLGAAEFLLLLFTKRRTKHHEKNESNNRDFQPLGAE